MDWNVPTISAAVSAGVAVVTLATTGYDVSWRMRTLKRLGMQTALRSALPDGKLADGVNDWIRRDTASLLARRAHTNLPAYKWLAYWLPVLAVTGWLQYAYDNPNVDPDSQIHHPWQWPAEIALLAWTLGFLSLRDRQQDRRNAMIKGLLDDEAPPTET